MAAKFAMKITRTIAISTGYKNLRSCGFAAVQHIKGRNQHRLQIAAGTELVVVLVDCVNHNLAKWVKAEAKTHNVPISCARRSWSAIYESLQGCCGCPQSTSCYGAEA
ncbi:MAG TPA: DUF2325 domain-containing protein [Symbiobacteriaceae bacterium]|nr:DUF2325 domain-containing protein [Symbiobacteriaceae bacterium]